MRVVQSFVLRAGLTDGTFEAINIETLKTETEEAKVDKEGAAE